ncbi:hydroxyisourate hydrolase [Acinetobacter sp. MD2(2019)]|uniref:hydroxyisourate hydrolase n=1 Tax=Acinetobacter sp. MD2(2019) TaxID=2605273 RepID=UPI002D1F4BDE|nr:hydroxyisourate hydrolase [Acinetobacter sp. MD2(2019)]MEB3753140.1 hydroxyisourate hydrolase [Acinetobacter sp. MD2(2019)]
MISTHILDTNLGKPASGVTIQLYDAAHQLIGQGVTDQDGRLKDFGLETLVAGEYQLEFAVAPYFAAQNVSTFFPKVCICFFIANANEHYHIPLLISPYAYSTYRGS